VPVTKLFATAKPESLVWGPAWLLWRAPDGRCFEGEGPDLDSAMAAARRKWRGRPLPLKVNGHEYRRRQLARVRRNR
jgi:hypothetical protein